MPSKSWGRISTRSRSWSGRDPLYASAHLLRRKISRSLASSPSRRVFDANVSYRLNTINTIDRIRPLPPPGGRVIKGLMELPEDVEEPHHRSSRDDEAEDVHYIA